MRILQARVSDSIRFFRRRFLVKYGLVDYHDHGQPAVFFGCYTNADRSAILRNNMLAVLIWGGSDAKKLGLAGNKRVLEAPHVRHLAISRSIVEDLERVGARFRYLPVYPSNPTGFVPVPLGPFVYVYSNHDAPTGYGMGVVWQAVKRLPDIRFMIRYSSPPHSVKPDQMPGVYAQCFIGLRLTAHDGLSNTVVELGLMGRRCVWNGWLANAVPWSTLDDVISAICEDRRKVGVTNAALAEGVRKDLLLPGEWLTTEFWR